MNLIGRHDLSTKARFWLRVKKTSNCWLWTGRTLGGYGHLYDKGKRIMAHRLSLEWSLGRQLVDGMIACHRCNVRACVNPEHLYEGTHQTNAQDSLAAGTMYFTKMPNEIRIKGAIKRSGALSAHTKLTQEQVDEIRSRHKKGESSRKLGREFGVNKSTVLRVSEGKTWKYA